MINAERILATLDKGLDHPVTRVIYDRAALALGFENPPEAPSPLRSAGALQNAGATPCWRYAVAIWSDKATISLLLIPVRALLIAGTHWWSATAW